MEYVCKQYFMVLNFKKPVNAFQVKVFSVTSALQDKMQKVKTTVVHIRSLTKAVTLPLNVTVMSHLLQAHFV